jgi:type II secretory pathway pseudopilin PulG
MNVPKDWSAMNLQETAGWRKANDAGYAMAALLVSIGVMLLMLTAAMPVWKQAATREKEAELVFRGEQYARAIGLFGRKYGGAFPPNLDVLIEQKFLRKKYKDPITNDEFQLLYQTTQRPGGPRNPGGPGSAGNSGGTERQSSGGGTTVGAGGGVGAAPTGVTGAQGAVVGVTSKSKERSIKLYKGRGRYNEWQFVYTPVTQTPGDNNGRPGRDRPGAGGSRDRPGGGNPGGAGGAGGAGGGGIPRPRPGPGGPPGS